MPDRPFVGLRPFESDESLLFFGREEQIRTLLDRLHHTGFVAVIGSSGSGKSSLVRAGLVPKLKAGILVETRDRWHVATMKPGRKPLTELARNLLALLPAETSAPDIKELREEIELTGTPAIYELLEPVFSQGDTNVLLLVDQFEELFRFEDKADDRTEEKKDFVSILLEMAEQKEFPIYVVITMRSDFLGDCDLFPGLPEALNESQYLVPRLGRKQLRQVIENPIRLYDSTIEPALVDRLLNEIGNKQDQLPVLQHALMRTWDEAGNGEIKRHLDFDAYEAAGRLENALSQHADSAMAGMSEEELRLTELLFRALTRKDDGNRRVRNPMQLDTLEKITGASRGELLDIVERFQEDGRSLLVVSGDTSADDAVIDISHESLIRQWPELQEWVDIEADSAHHYQNMVRASLEWENSGKSTGMVWRDPKLETELAWWDGHELSEAWTLRYDGHYALTREFLQASNKVREEERALRVAAQQSKRERKLKNIALAAAAVSIILLVGVIVQTVRLAQTNRITTNDATSMLASTNAQYTAFFNSDLSALLAITAYFINRVNRVNRVKSEPTSIGRQAEIQVMNALRSSYYYYFRRDKESDLQTRDLEAYTKASTVALSPNGRWIAAGTDSASIWLWDTTLPDPVIPVHEELSSPLRSLAFSPDTSSMVLASASNDSIVVWTLDEQNNMRPLNIGRHDGWVLDLAFSPDGNFLASTGNDQKVRVWNWKESGQVGEFDIEDHALVSGDAITPIFSEAIVFIPSEDGELIVTSNVGDIWKWNWKSGFVQDALAREYTENDRIMSVAINPAGGTMILGIANSVQLWSLGSADTSPSWIRTRYSSGGVIFSVAYSLDGRWIATGGGGKQVQMWPADLSSGTPVIVGEPESEILDIVFSRNQIVSAGADARIQFWDTGNEDRMADDLCRALENIGKTELSDREWKDYVGDTNTFPQDLRYRCPDSP